jgi:hypothetical protein
VYSLGRFRIYEQAYLGLISFSPGRMSEASLGDQSPLSRNDIESNFRFFPFDL